MPKEEHDKIVNEYQSQIKGLKAELKGVMEETKTKTKLLDEYPSKVQELENKLQTAEVTIARLVELMIHATATPGASSSLSSSPSSSSFFSSLFSNKRRSSAHPAGSQNSIIVPPWIEAMQQTPAESRQKLLTEAEALKSDWITRMEAEVGELRKEQNRRKEQDQEARDCVVCMEAVKTVVFQPCSHVCACMSCADGLKECPVCRETITSSIRAYIW